MQAKIVGVGVDTLKVNLKRLTDEGIPDPVQELPGDLEARLIAWQEEARQERKPLPLPPDFSFEDARLSMYPNGASAWKYILRNDCLEIKIGPRLQLPMLASVTFQSAYLWGFGPVRAVQCADDFLCQVFGQVAMQVAQIDACVDLVGLKLPTEWERVFISHALKKRPYGESQKDHAVYKGRKLETVNFSGHGRPVSCKLYNKSKEIEHSDKKWFEVVWQRRSWEPGEEVWRVEFSLEREALREMGLDDVYDTLRNVKRLWAYCTEEWLRMVRPGQTKNRTRWPTHPTWEKIQRAFDRYGDKELDRLGPLVREPRRVINKERAEAAIAGYMTTYAAWDQEMPEDIDPAAIFATVYDKVIERWGKRGIVPGELIREKRFLYSEKA